MLSKKLVAAAAAVALAAAPAAASPAKTAAAARQAVPAAEKIEEGSQQFSGYRGGIIIPFGIIIALGAVGYFVFKKKKKVSP
jgi:hypothetical protein